jgi:hypothetical protein
MTGQKLVSINERFSLPLELSLARKETKKFKNVENFMSC